MAHKKFEIFDIWVPKTPQRGTWCAGVTVRAVQQEGLQASWNGGSRTYEGEHARLLPFPERPTILLDGIGVGNGIEFFLAIDDDPAKAGTSQAADQLRFRFNASGSSYKYEDSKWTVVVEFNLHD